MYFKKLSCKLYLLCLVEDGGILLGDKEVTDGIVVTFPAKNIVRALRLLLGVLLSVFL